MPFGTLSFWPILLAAVVSFAFGALWYGTLSRPWMAAAGIDAVEMERRNPPPGLYSAPAGYARVDRINPADF